MQEKPRLIMTVGLPRSGKTTYAKTTGFPIVNPDSIRLALHGNAFLPDAEQMVWAIAKYMVKALFLAGHGCVVLDATNTTKARRDEWISKNWDRQLVVFFTAKEDCLLRATVSGKQDLWPVIERMAAAYEPPETSELSEAECALWGVMES